MIRYFCSDGERVSQATIDKRRSASYRDHDDGTIDCRGCGGRAEGHAHIISQARCKELHHTEWIWARWNYFKACHKCNSDFASFKGDACKRLRNYEQCLQVLKARDPATYAKYCNL